MALKALKCPNCDANIQVDDDRDYGFCSYCGAQIQVKEVVEIRHTGTLKIDESAQFEKKMEDGTAFLKMGEFYKAEQSFYRMIREYPGRAEGYEMLICAITRDHQLYIKENYDRVMKLAEKMVAVASDGREGYYEKLYRDICVNFEIGMQEQRQQERLLKIGRRNEQIKENIMVFVVSIVALAACYFFGKDSLWFPIALVLICAIACASLIMVIACKVSKNALLRKGNE